MYNEKIFKELRERNAHRKKKVVTITTLITFAIGVILLVNIPMVFYPDVTIVSTFVTAIVASWLSNRKVFAKEDAILNSEYRIMDHVDAKNITDPKELYSKIMDYEYNSGPKIMTKRIIASVVFGLLLGLVGANAGNTLFAYQLQEAFRLPPIEEKRLYEEFQKSLEELEKNQKEYPSTYDGNTSENYNYDEQDELMGHGFQHIIEGMTEEEIKEFYLNPAP